ncbi:hypothetical protein CerSpe_081630 [Prunus speciosa]
MDIHPWLCSNLLSKANRTDGIQWFIIFVFTCWFFWKWRNRHIFSLLGNSNYDPVKTVLTAARRWMQAACATSKESEKVQVFLAWEPPGNGQFKFNVDGSRRSSSGCIGAGGVIRNSRGDWASSFSVNLGKGQILEAEVWGLFCRQLSSLCRNQTCLATILLPH